MAAWQSVSLEVELTPTAWTDITSHIAYPLVIRQGRPTEFDDVGPGRMTFALHNDDGRFMPGNPASPLFPYWVKGKRVRWRVTKAGVTYTRFIGWITALAPEFPSDSTIGSVVAVTAVDALGLLAQRKLRSSLTEITLAIARNNATTVDVYEADPGTTSNRALMTQYSPDPAAGAPFSVWLGSNLSFGTDQDVSFGGVVSCQGPTSSKTVMGLQASRQNIWVHIKTPSSQLQAGTIAVVTSFHTSPSGGSSLCHLAFMPNGSSNDLVIRNAANSATTSLIGPVPAGQWVKVQIKTVSPATSSEWLALYQNGLSGYVATVAIDARTIRAVEFPTATGNTTSVSFGGVGALGIVGGPAATESFSAATAGSLAYRVGSLASSLSQLPIAVSTLGSLSGDVATGEWSGRAASEVLQEMMRSYSGIAWARSRDSVVCAIESAQLHPDAHLVVIDTDTDCAGSPRLVDGVEQRPTRIDVQWRGGTAAVVDTTAETGGESRARRITTVCTSLADAQAVGQAILTRASAGGGVRFASVAVDLLGGKTDHTAALFSESAPLSGLFPTQRIRLAVPGSHFGVGLRDAYVQGWVEEYGPDRATVTLDTSPADLYGAEFTYGNGAYGADVYGA